MRSPRNKHSQTKYELSLCCEGCRPLLEQSQMNGRFAYRMRKIRQAKPETVNVCYLSSNMPPEQ